jgi:beta-lactamase superfamily II metal-dependent hydrolase
MPWELEIHVIDVGQGESSLVIARNAGRSRTMLIDGGDVGYGETVHNYVAAKLGPVTPLDHIVVSHYDGDHSGGILALLTADNLYGLCSLLAQAAGNAAFAAASRAKTRLYQISAAAAALYTAANGGYDAGPGKNFGGLAVEAGRMAADKTIPPDTTDVGSADLGISTGSTHIDRKKHSERNPTLLATTSRQLDAAQFGGLAAGTTEGSAEDRATAAFAAVFHKLRTTVKEQSRFQTSGLYHKVNIIDIGSTGSEPGDYDLVISGTLTSPRTKIPGINRSSSRYPDLGREVLWNAGPQAAPAPANSPAAFVVARRAFIWKAPKEKCPIVGGQRGNDVSMGMVVRFNQFFYYTGGDLPSQGEDLVADAIMTHGLPDPNGKADFPPAHRIACFKCGHHGSEHSTSQHFLDTAKPRGAFISCGTNSHGDSHPNQALVDRLHGHKSIRHFYLTNCKVDATHIAAANGEEQLTFPGNKSRVAGDNDNENLRAGRHRGDIKIFVDQAESTSTSTKSHDPEPLRRYRVEYFDHDDSPDGNGLIGNCVESTIF